MKHEIDRIIEILRKSYMEWREPIVTEISHKKRDPYKILISTIISLRTKDDVTREASRRLYKRAGTPEKMIRLQPETIEKAIYPAGFYKNKALTILNVSYDLIEHYQSKVPDNLDELLKLKGVGR